jgi:hypothetical protein
MSQRLEGDDLIIFEDFFENMLSEFLKLPLDNINYKSKLLEQLIFFGTTLELNWNVIGITPNAIRKIKEQGNTKGLERAHIKHRRHWIQEMCSKEWNNYKEIKEYIQEHNKVILCLRQENRDENNFSNIQDQIIPIPFGHFQSKISGYSFSKKDKEFLENL